MTKLDQFRVASRVVPLEPGMHIFRYATVVPGDQAVLISLQSSPMGKGQVDFFPGEGVTRNTLVKLGDCVIARVKGAAAGILVTEYRSPNATAHVDLRLDRIDTTEAIIRQGAPALVADAAPKGSATVGAAVVGSEQAAQTIAKAASSAAAPKAPIQAHQPAPASRAIALQLTANIQGQGPVEASSLHDEWLGDPSSTQVLEGFNVTWPDMPQGVQLIYTCRIQSLGQMPATRAGNYVGTRGKGLPIHSVSFLLAGPRAGEFELSGQVAFSGHPPQALQPGLALAGPTGREHLVALRPRIVSKTSPHASRQNGLSSDPATQHNATARKIQAHHTTHG